MESPSPFVQACHAAMESTKKYEWKEHPHLVICGVKDEKRLIHEYNKLLNVGIKLIEWREPDLDNQLTAFATGPISGADRWHFRNFQLLKGEQK
jgi:hypothetical protein